MTQRVENFEMNINEKTIYFIDDNGEYHDLNADGEEITTIGELHEFIHELKEQGAFSDSMIPYHAFKRNLNQMFPMEPPKGFESWEEFTS